MRGLSGRNVLFGLWRSAQLSGLAAVVAITGQLVVLTPVAASAPFGVEKPLPSPGPAAAVEYQISNDYAKKEASRFGGARVASRMLYRATAETPSTDGIRFSLCCWAGWVANTVSTPYWVNGAFGSFYAQDVCSTCTTLASWVGVGGWNASYIAQAGFDEKKRRAWYELYPNNPVYLSIYPAAGDSLYVDVHLDYGTYKWYILFDDASSGAYWSNEFSFNPDENSAEWVMELTGGSSVPRSNSVQFNSSRWEDENGYLQNANSSEAVPTSTSINAFCGTITPGSLSSGQNFLDSVSGC